MVKFFSVFKRRKKRRVSLGVKGYKSKKGCFLIAYINNITRNLMFVKFARIKICGNYLLASKEESLNFRDKTTITERDMNKKL